MSGQDLGDAFGPGCQPSASAGKPSSQSGIPIADDIAAAKRWRALVSEDALARAIEAALPGLPRRPERQARYLADVVLAMLADDKCMAVGDGNRSDCSLMAQRIEQRLAALGRTARDVSIRATGSPDTIRYILTRGVMPSAARLNAIAKELGVTVAALLGDPEVLDKREDDSRDQPTPGPWLLVMDGDWPIIVSEGAVDEEGDRVAVADLFHGGYDYSYLGYSLLANGRLMAAAPDMLQALRALNAGARPSNWDDEDIDEGERDAWRQLDAALTKAEPR